MAAGEEAKDTEKPEIDAHKRPFGITNLSTEIVASFRVLDALFMIFMINCILMATQSIWSGLAFLVWWAGSKVYWAHRSITSELELRRIRIKHGLDLYHHFTKMKKRMKMLASKEKDLDLTSEKIQLLLAEARDRELARLVYNSALQTLGTPTIYEEQEQTPDLFMQMEELVATWLMLKAEIGKERLCLAIHVLALKNEIETLKGKVGYDFLGPYDGGDTVDSVEHNEGGDVVGRDVEHNEGVANDVEHTEGGDAVGRDVEHTADGSKVDDVEHKESRDEIGHEVEHTEDGDD